MFAGGVLSWLVLLPLLSILGQLHRRCRSRRSSELREQPALRIDPDVGRGQLWSAYIRYIGAGAVLAAGLITLGAHASRPSSSSFRESLKDFGAGAGGGARSAPSATSR